MPGAHKSARLVRSCPRPSQQLPSMLASRARQRLLLSRSCVASSPSLSRRGPATTWSRFSFSLLYGGWNLYDPGTPGGRLSMLAFSRAGLLAALFALFLVPAASVLAATPDKPSQRDDLADAAIRLEGQIKQDAGTIAKPLATLEREADDAFRRNDYRAGTQALGQTVTLAPHNATNWLRLARAIRQIWPATTQ